MGRELKQGTGQKAVKRTGDSIRSGNEILEKNLGLAGMR
jgi:hypothetical protein